MTDSQRAAMQAVLDAVETVLNDAFHRRFPECCGHPQGNECCGNWSEARTPTDNRIMDVLSPVQRRLSDVLRAALDEPQGGLYLTIVYRDVQPGAETSGLTRHPKVAAVSWSHAIDDRNAARAALAETEPCWCDRQQIGEPGVSCGDCPTRDYQSRGATEMIDDRDSARAALKEKNHD